MRIRQLFAWILAAELLVFSGIAVAQDANQTSPTRRNIAPAAL
jgi:hypothetical protein